MMTNAPHAPHATETLQTPSNETNATNDNTIALRPIQTPAMNDVVVVQPPEFRYGDLIFSTIISRRGSVAVVVRNPILTGVSPSGLRADWNVLREADSRHSGVFLPPGSARAHRNGLGLSYDAVHAYVQWLRFRPEYSDRFRPHYHRED